MRYKIEQREVVKAREVANEYTKKGYRVILNPSDSELPEEIKKLNFQPDIIATLGDTKLIIEVKSFESIKNKKLGELAEKIKLLEDWDLELVYTNPRSKLDFPETLETATYIDVKHGLDRALKFLDTNTGKEYTDAALLLIWSVVENSLRVSCKYYRPKENYSIPKGLIRDSVILGVIGKDDQIFLEKMMAIRNELAHGVSKIVVSNNDLKKLIALGYSIIEQNA